MTQMRSLPTATSSTGPTRLMLPLAALIDSRMLTAKGHPLPQ